MNNTINDALLERKTHNSDKHLLSMVSGSVVDLLDPRPESILESDIIHGLSKIQRYGGQINVDYSVLSHVNLCVDAYKAIHEKINPKLNKNLMCKFCFFHDAAEAYLGDIPRPLKYIPQFYDFYSILESNFETVIYMKLCGRIPTQEEINFIKMSDLFVLAAEHETPGIRSNRKYVVSIMEEIESKSILTMKDVESILDNLRYLIKFSTLAKLSSRHVRSQKFELDRHSNVS